MSSEIKSGMVPAKNIQVGKVRDAHGMGGEIFLISFSKDISWLEKLKSMTFEGMSPNEKGKHHKSRQTYQIKAYKPHKAGALVRLETVTDRTAAEALIGFIAEVPFSALTSEKGEAIFLSEIEGFTVFDGDTEVGTITAFSTNGAQDLLLVNTKDRMVEIPLVPAFVSEIAWADRKLVMKLPAGLLDAETQAGSQVKAPDDGLDG